MLTIDRQDPFPFHFLLHSAHLLEERLRGRLTPHEVQPHQARVLDALDRMGAASQVELARELAVSAASMSTMASRLLRAGLIEKRVDERERRSNVLTLTPLGRSLLATIYREWRGVDLEIVAAIGVDDAERLGTLTHKLRNALGGFTPGGESA